MHLPLSLDRAREAVDQSHDLLLRQTFVPSLLFFLLDLLRLRKSRTGESAIGCRVLTLSFYLYSLRFLFQLRCFALLRTEKGQHLVFKLGPFFGVDRRTSLLCCLLGKGIVEELLMRWLALHINYRLYQFY